LSRQTRYDDFEKFADSAEATFNALLDADARAKSLSNFYSFYAVKGGAMGGLDKRVFEVFFGNRPIDHVETFESKEGEFPQRQSKLLTERGVCLRYERTDIGTVICTLFPAETKSLHQREDSILLEWIAHPRSLHSQCKLNEHWRAFISYMECTSVDGEPSVLDKLRVSYLRFTQILVIDGRAGRRRITSVAGSIFSYALTIGLSGFLLTLINMFGASRDAEKLQTDYVAESRDLSDARGVVRAQSERIMSLEQRIDAIQCPKPKSITLRSSGTAQKRAAP